MAKTKKGKGRLDRWYHLAKAQGKSNFAHRAMQALLVAVTQLRCTLPPCMRRHMPPSCRLPLPCVLQAHPAQPHILLPVWSPLIARPVRGARCAAAAAAKGSTALLAAAGTTPCRLGLKLEAGRQLRMGCRLAGL